MNLTPAMRRQLQDLYDVQVLQLSSGGKRVHLPSTTQAPRPTKPK